jgi:hypothetical protein
MNYIYLLVLLIILIIIIILIINYQIKNKENFHGSGFFIPGYWPIGYPERLKYYSRNPILISSDKYYN